MYNNANEFINEIFSSLLTRYQINLEPSMKGRNFGFNCIGGTYYKCHGINVSNDKSIVSLLKMMKKKWNKHKFQSTILVVKTK